MGVGHVLLARSSITIMGLVVTPVAVVSGPMTETSRNLPLGPKQCLLSFAHISVCSSNVMGQRQGVSKVKNIQKPKKAC